MKSFLTQFVASALAAIVAAWLTAWYTNQPTRAIGTVKGLKAVIFTGVPAWLVILSVAGVVWVGLAAYLQRSKIVKLEKCVAEWENKTSTPVLPRLHVAWNPNQTVWAVGSTAGEPAMQMVGRAHFSQSDASETIILNRAYLEGTEARVGLNIRVPAKGAVYEMLVTFITPVIGREGEPLSASLIIEDHKNRKYHLAPHTFRFGGAPIEEPDPPERNYWE